MLRTDYPRQPGDGHVCIGTAVRHAHKVRYVLCDDCGAPIKVLWDGQRCDFSTVVTQLNTIPTRAAAVLDRAKRAVERGA